MASVGLKTAMMRSMLTMSSWAMMSKSVWLSVASGGACRVHRIGHDARVGQRGLSWLLHVSTCCQCIWRLSCIKRTWRTVRLPGMPVMLTALRVMYVTVPLPVVMFTGSGTSDTCAAQAR